MKPVCRIIAIAAVFLAILGEYGFLIWFWAWNGLFALAATPVFYAGYMVLLLFIIRRGWKRPLFRMIYKETLAIFLAPALAVLSVWGIAGIFGIGIPS